MPSRPKSCTEVSTASTSSPGRADARLIPRVPGCVDRTVSKRIYREGSEVHTSIQTPRLELVPATVELVQAELRDSEDFGRLLDAHVPESWPPELYDRAAAEYTIARLNDGAEQRGWWLHYIVMKATSPDPRLVIGTCGFKGPPAADGTVEIGYGILPEFRRRGYAAEAVKGLLLHAFRYRQVTRVSAETLPNLVPSIAVLRKSGFRCVGEGSEDGIIRYDLLRAEFESQGSRFRVPS